MLCVDVEVRYEKAGVVSKARSLDGLLVGLGLSLVRVLVELVGGSAHGTGDTVGDGVVGGVALGLLLVGLLGCLGGVALDGLGDVVGGVGDGVGDLANDTLVRLVDVRGRHFDRVGWVGWFGLSEESLEDVLMRGRKKQRGKVVGWFLYLYCCTVSPSRTCNHRGTFHNDRMSYPLRPYSFAKLTSKAFLSLLTILSHGLTL